MSRRLEVAVAWLALAVAAGLAVYGFAVVHFPH